MFKSLILSALTLVLILGGANGHSYHSGRCPSVEPLSQFNMRQFLGIWYAIQKTSTASTCLVYNITLGDEPGEYKIEQTSQHFALGLTPLKHEYSYTGIITVPDYDVPGKMNVKFPLSVAGSSTFTVFMTDYTSYAGIFSCQKIGFVHRRSATLLSRERTLDKSFVDKMRTRLASYSVDPFDLSIIEQMDCPREPSTGLNIRIDDDTFSARSVGNFFRRVGQKISDGFRYVFSGARTLYYKMINSRDTSDQSSENELLSRTVVTPEEDAEWIRF